MDKADFVGVDMNVEFLYDKVLYAVFLLTALCAFANAYVGKFGAAVAMYSMSLACLALGIMRTGSGFTSLAAAIVLSVLIVVTVGMRFAATRRGKRTSAV